MSVLRRTRAVSFLRRARTVFFVLAAAGVAASAIFLISALAAAPSRAAPSIDQLHSQLGQQQARQQSLSAGIQQLSRLIASLQNQISLVQSRETTMRAQLASDRAALARVQVSLARERRLLTLLLSRLARARVRLSRQLVSSYEANKPDLVAVVVEASGFNDLLERVSFLHDAQSQQQAIIRVTREARDQADSAQRRLSALQASDRRISDVATLRVRALAGMNALLQSRQAALRTAQGAQRAALGASRARGAQLQAAISSLQAQQAAAQRAQALQAAQQASAAQASGGGGTGSAAGSGGGGGGLSPPSGGWAIPYAIVLCESGGQNLPPNSSGASGYYQIIPSTWKLFGGPGPAAYLVGKAEQDAVAARIWNGGAGASNWVCAGIVGIH